MRFLGALFLIIYAAMPVSAQNRLSMSAKACSADLNALETVVKGQVTPASPPRQIGGKCIANNVSIVVAGTAFQVDFIKWSRGDFASLSGGKLPKKMGVSFSGLNVLRAKSSEPAWQILKRQRDISGGIRFNFSSATGKLALSAAYLQFMNSTGISLTAELRNVSQMLPQNLGMGALAMTIDELQLIIDGKGVAQNPVTEIVLAQVQKNNPDMTVKQQLARADMYAQHELSLVLAPSDVADIRHILADAPKLNHDVVITMSPVNSFAILRFALLATGTAAALDGAGLTVSYGR